MAVVGVELALEELADEDKRVAILAQADKVRQQHLTETRGEPRGKVAYLIGVRQNDEAGFELLDQLLNRQYVTVSCVVFQERVLNAIAFVQLLAGKLTAQRLEFVARDGSCQWLPGSFCHLLPGGQCLPGHAVVRSAAML